MSGWNSPDPDYELKQRFAKAWFETGDAFAAARAVFGDDDIGRVLWYSTNWIALPEVIALRDALIAAEPDPELPDEKETARDAYRLAMISVGPLTSLKDRVAALKLYAELRGFLDDKAKKDSNEKKPLPTIVIRRRSDVAATT